MEGCLGLLIRIHSHSANFYLLLKILFTMKMTDTDDKKGDDGQTEPVYGGCEGPNAMYVKLISSDDHEFIINRDYALTSGTIKAMLSGPGKNLATL